VLHNCLIDSGATNNIIPLSVMQALGMECTRHYETGEIIYAIDSRKVPAYGEIKYFYAWITATPHITTIFTIIVVDLPPTYGVVLGRDWCSMIGGYIMNDGSCMMLPQKNGTMVRVPREVKKSVSFKKKENELMRNYLDVGMGNYVVFDSEQLNIPKQEKENDFQGYWRMSFDGACSKYGNGAGIIFKSPKDVIHPHAIRLEFPCTNNEAEYEALIQGMIISLQMKVENLVITGDSELIINHIRKKYKVKKEKLKCYAKRVPELMYFFQFFNISFIPIEKNQKVDALAVSTSLFNTEDCQGQGTYHVKTIFDHQFQTIKNIYIFFENDEHVVNFLTDDDPINKVDPVEDHNLQGEVHKENHKLSPKKYINLESLFTRDDQINISEPLEEPFVRKVQETQKINIGTLESPKYINLGTSCTKEEIDQYTHFLKIFKMYLHGVMMI
jgi:ribonuclease HI